MSTEREVLTPEQAIATLLPGDTVHTFMNPHGMLIGADWSREMAEERIRGAEILEVGGEQCVRMGHGLVLHEAGGRMVFVESTAGRRV